MVLHKKVNGVQVRLSAQEEADLRAEWHEADQEQQKKLKEFGYSDERKKEIGLDPELEIAHQLDACYHGFSGLIDEGVKLPKETRAWVRKLKAIKEKHPKPR